MIKHILGFFVFSSIVGSSVIVSGVIGGSSAALEERTERRVFTIYSEKKRKRKKKKRRHCDPSRPHYWHGTVDTSEVEVNRAVLDKETGKLKLFLDFSKGTPEEFDIHLTFSVSDRFGDRMLKTEVIPGSVWTENYETELDWLQRFQQTGNLFVTARVSEKGGDVFPLEAADSRRRQVLTTGVE